MKSVNLSRISLIFLCCILMILPVSSSEFSYLGPKLTLDYAGPIIVDNSHLKYSASDRLTFYTETHLKNNKPQLLPLRSTIDTWAAMLNIHPLLLSEVVSNYFSGKPVDNSFENKQQVFNIAAGIAEAYHNNKDQALAASIALVAVAQAYEFEINLPAQFASKKATVEHNFFRGQSGPPLYDYFQPPWPHGELWAGGGVHSNTGGGSAPRNSLDFIKIFVDWGDDTSQFWVTASEAGTARVFSSCSMQVIHPNGWVSSYYHLDNIQVADMDPVVANQDLSNYADNLEQAICQGGSSTGPHVHFSIYYDGDPIEIDEPNVDFISWKHKAGEGQYDSNCDRSYYTMVPDGDIICPFFRNLPNNGSSELIFGNGFE